MSSGLKCRNCGSTDIEEDNARGDAVCTNCGSVLEDSLIVSEVQFEEVGRGASAIGQFVSAESTGGATNYGYGKFQVGSGNESREVTIKKAKKEITHLCQQLQLTQHYIDTALNFFKMALMRHLTRGRKSTHIYAACVYITCRTEGTSHLLIDISDVQQICSYELGRTYLKLTHALCINIPAVDPCLYIMRFANKLQFGNKTHEVSMTALRIVQRMKKDSLHSGRRPTGLCGAALLIAGRMHEFNRMPMDIVKIVKIHESTLRKRLVEFSETPSSLLTLEEFMSVDLEAEQDPPSFKAARKKDRDRIKDIGEMELTQLQREIDDYLEKEMKKTHKAAVKCFPGLNAFDQKEELDAEKFITQSNRDAISQFMKVEGYSDATIKAENIKFENLKPDIEQMITLTPEDLMEIANSKQVEEQPDDLTYLDDDEEIDGYILSNDEVTYKTAVWNSINSGYLKELEEKEERLAKEREEGKPEKKKRKPRKKCIGPSSSASEAIEKMLQEKKISNKINYDILRSLTEAGCILKNDANSAEPSTSHETQSADVKDIKFLDEPSTSQQKYNRGRPAYTSIGGPKAKMSKLEIGLPVVESAPTLAKHEPVVVENDDIEDDGELYGEHDNEVDTEREYSSLKDMLNQGEDDDYCGYEEDNY
ncbi:transcription factor IIIB 90 kDa subunit isoform X1 [Teleopsis dalmanni]|uniref:transcription factor IIIB 90 kDa subunit isoform X1 n=1 Tax=Teleopsis dalmanni TaxID=139649 RepID=UPI0018CC8177|nr:transcription factor IIIB 90 kDa subunit isoform X1 [Teleopsis dalmanni]